MEEVSADLRAGGLAMVDEKDITDSVLRALQLDSAASVALVQKHIPW